MIGEVLVVGAGPVGLTAALALRTRDVATTVLEARAEGGERPGSRAIFIHRETLTFWDKISPGLGSSVADAGISWRDKRTFWGDRQVFARTYPPPPAGSIPHSTNLAQTRTEQILFEACIRAGVTFEWETEVVTVEVGSSPTRATATTTDGRTRSAPYLLAADGARSRVRQSLGIRLEGTRDDSAFIVVDVAEDAQTPLAPERRYHYAHPAVGGRNVLLVPFAGGWRVDLQCLPGDRPEEFNDPAGVRRWLARVLPASYADRVTWSSTYRFAHVIASDFIDPTGRVLLLGEAAHLFAPFGARGMNSGVVDAVVAADAVAEALAVGCNNGIEPARPIMKFAIDRRRAAERNRHAAGLALDHMRARDPMTRVKRRAAAELARVFEWPGRWLDSAPYGPRQQQNHNNRINGQY
jgi:3-(3-hydroxy-phenyl)propionate hydroxylase